MRPPKGFENEKFPLRHRLIYSFGLGLTNDNINTAFMPIVRSSKNTTATSPLVDPGTIKVNPHNSGFVEDFGSLCGNMSIIDRMTISLKFNMTHYCGPTHNITHTFSGSPTALTASTFEGDDIPAIKFLWRPIFNVFPEKLDAADDDTTKTVSEILALTKDPTNEDVVALTTNDLPTLTPALLNHPISTVNGVEAFTDFNMTTDLIMEDHVFDEDLLQTALRRYTNKGALRSCLGKTRHVTLSRSRPYSNFYIDKFVPRAIRRIQPYGFFGIQVHMPMDTDVDQYAMSKNPTAATPHIGVKAIINYHEWNFEHDQDRGTPA